MLGTLQLFTPFANAAALLAGAMEYEKHTLKTALVACCSSLTTLHPKREQEQEQKT